MDHTTDNMKIETKKLANTRLPEWFLIEILIRLPPKFLSRFKFVSKQCFSIISQPWFRRAYISRASSLSSQPQQPWTLISSLMHREPSQFDQYCIPDHLILDELYSQVPKSSFSPLHIPRDNKLHGGEETYEILEVSNGLLLCGSYMRSGKYIVDDITLRNLYICNPVTGQWIALPRLSRFPDNCLFFGWGFHTHVEDHVLVSYRVVRLEILTRTYTLRFQVFSFETGEWKNFKLSTNIGVLYDLQREDVTLKEVFTLNGVMHWIIKKYRRQIIIAYDPYQSPEQVRLILCPEERLGHRDGLCGEYKGKLRYLELYDHIDIYFGSRFLKVWVLNDDHHSGEGGGWSLQHNIRTMDIMLDGNLDFTRPSVEPLYFHPFDLDIVYLGWDDNVVSFNFETRRLEIQQKCHKRIGNDPKHPLGSTFLLVIPPWQMSIPKPKRVRN